MVSDEVLVNRFEQVGGVLRPLMGSARYYRQYLDDLKNCIGDYRFYDVYNDGDPFSLIRGHDEKTSQYLLHYDVVSADFHRYKPRMASALVTELMSERNSRWQNLKNE